MSVTEKAIKCVLFCLQNKKIQTLQCYTFNGISQHFLQISPSFFPTCANSYLLYSDTVLVLSWCFIMTGLQTEHSIVITAWIHGLHRWLIGGWTVVIVGSSFLASALINATNSTLNNTSPQFTISLLWLRGNKSWIHKFEFSLDFPYSTQVQKIYTQAQICLLKPSNGWCFRFYNVLTWQGKA